MDMRTFQTPSMPVPETNKNNATLGNTESPISWKYFFFKIWFNVKRLFLNPFKERKPELRLLEQVDILINESEDSDKVTGTCEKYIALHRIVENTKARGRLEKWITKLIAYYLFAVFAVVVLAALSHEKSPLGFELFKLSDTVMITILSATAVNIVALGIILVRGLFHENESHDLSKEKPSDIKSADI